MELPIQVLDAQLDIPLPPLDLEAELAVLSLSAEFDANQAEEDEPVEVGLEAQVNPPAPEFQRVTEEKETEHPNNATRQILKELKELNSESYSEKQLRVEMVDDNPFKLNVILTPNDGLYKDGHYEMTMTLSENYPSSKPSFHCPCEIFHPNIDYSGSICFSLLGESASHLRITDYAHGLLWLLYYPNLYSRMNSDCPRNEEEYSRLVRSSIVGGKVCGREYKRSRRLPKEKEEGEGSVNLKGEKNGKEWVWKLKNEEWVQVFVDSSSSSSSSS